MFSNNYQNFYSTYKIITNYNTYILHLPPWKSLALPCLIFTTEDGKCDIILNDVNDEHFIVLLDNLYALIKVTFNIIHKISKYIDLQ